MDEEKKEANEKIKQYLKTLSESEEKPIDTIGQDSYYLEQIDGLESKLEAAYKLINSSLALQGAAQARERNILKDLEAALQGSGAKARDRLAGYKVRHKEQQHLIDKWLNDFVLLRESLRINAPKPPQDPRLPSGDPGDKYDANRDDQKTGSFE